MHKQPPSEEEQRHKQVERLLAESRRLSAESLYLSEDLKKSFQQLQDSFDLMGIKNPQNTHS